MQNVTDTIPVTPAKIVAAASIATPAAPAVFVILMERKEIISKTKTASKNLAMQSHHKKGTRCSRAAGANGYCWQHS